MDIPYSHSYFKKKETVIMKFAGERESRVIINFPGIFDFDPKRIEIDNTSQMQVISKSLIDQSICAISKKINELTPNKKGVWAYIYFNSNNIDSALIKSIAYYIIEKVKDINDKSTTMETESDFDDNRFLVISFC
jgi:hypothetical protein